MNHKFRFSILLLALHPFSGTAAQSAPETSARPGAVQFKVESSSMATMADGSGHQLILERVKPPVLPVPAPPVLLPAVDPAVRAARRAAWALKAKKDHRLVSLTGISYPNGQTFLSWSMPSGPGQEWQTFEAWTLTDFGAAWFVQEFEVGQTIYMIFPSVHAASKWELRRPFPGPLYFPPGSPGFRLIKGDPKDPGAMEFMTALHQIFLEQCPGTSVNH